MPQWRKGRVTLLGDSCHPMTPYMAQGAATAIEDAAVIARCLAGVGHDGIESALQQYEEHRKPRTARIQKISRLNDLDKIKMETARVFSYDAWHEILP